MTFHLILKSFQDSDRFDLGLNQNEIQAVNGIRMFKFNSILRYQRS